MKLRLESVYFSVTLVLVLGLGLFSYGFFPLSHSSTEKSSLFDFPKTLGDFELTHGSYTSHFHRVVFMIIDALRWDFVSGKDSMSYLRNLIQRNESCLIKLKVHAPTVTMPRIKAMTSGTVPNFIDLVLNFGGSEMNVDNFVSQMKSRGKLIFYGDSTWTKLFPNTFTRHGENEDSLFVNDFYKGDKNVTERLAAELIHPDWKMLVLHYLGLDHIGHVEGPFSDKVPGKLEEMDKQVTKVVTAMAKWKLRTERPSLFLLTGDHGMRDTGGHGGSSPGETLVPLVVTGAKCESSEEVYNQIDLATTFSVLLGLPIPHSSIGVVIPELLGDLTGEQQLFAFYYNGERLLAKVRQQFRIDDFGEQEFYKQHQEAVELHKLLLLGNSTHLLKRAKLLYTSSSQEMSNMLSQTFLKYDLVSICLGIFLVSSGTFVFILGLFSKSPDHSIQLHVKPKDCVMSLLVGMLSKHFVCKLFPVESELFRFNIPMNLFFLGLVLMAFYLFKVMKSLFNGLVLPVRVDFLTKYSVFVTFLHVASLGASSFIEEEHQIWYFVGNSLFIILFLKELNLHVWWEGEFVLFKMPTEVQREERKNKKEPKKEEKSLLKSIEKCHNSILGFLSLITTHVVIRRLNQTGDKWSHLKDIGDFLVEKDHMAYLTVLIVFSLILTCFALHRLGGLLTNILTFTALLLALFYRASIGQVLVFNTVFSSPKWPVILFWLNVTELILIEFLPGLYRIAIQRSVNRIELSRFMGSLVTVFSVVSVLLHKPQNVILVPICVLTCRWTKDKVFAIYPGATQRTMWIIGTHLWIGKMFFFYQGNSNSLATIDLNAGYIGLDSYQPVLVGLLLTLNTFAGPILTFLLALCHIYEQLCAANLTVTQCKSIRETISVDLPRIQAVQLGLPLTVYLIVATLFRHHLFVWTVFSPKLIYELFSFGLNAIFWGAFYGWTRVTNSLTTTTITS